MTKHFYLSVLLVACVVRAVGVTDVQARVSPPPVACLGDSVRPYPNSVLGRIRDLEQRIEQEQAARPAERTDSTRLLDQTRTDGAARLETFSGELRSREQALDAAKEEARGLHDSGSVCGRALEVATKEAANVAAQRDAKVADLREASRQIAARGEVRTCTEAGARQKGEAQSLTPKLRAELEASSASAAAVAADLAKVKKELATNRNALVTAETGRAKSTERAEVAERGLAEIAKQQESERQRIADLESAVAQSRTATESVRADGKEKARLLAEAWDSRAKELSEKVAGLERGLAQEKVARAKAEESAAGSDKRAAAFQEDVKKARAALAARENELGARIAALEKAGEEEAARCKLGEEESAKNLADSEKAASSLHTDLESQTKDVASLREQLKAAAGLRAAFEAEQQKSAAGLAQVSALRDELAATKAALSEARAAEAKAVKKAEETAAEVVVLAKREEESARRLKGLEDERRDDPAEIQKQQAALEEKERLLGETRAEAEKARAAAQGQEKRVVELAQKVTTLDEQLADAASSRSKTEETATETSRRLAPAEAEAKKLADALSAKDAELKARTQDLARAREEAAAKLKAVDTEAASKLAASEKTAASMRSDLDSRAKEMAVLEQQVAEAKRAQSAQASSDESQHASGVQGDLERARTEIARLNNENLEQQALIDELTSAEKAPPEPRSPKPKSHREETARARKAPPIAPVSLKTGDRGSAEAGRSGTDPLAEQLAHALARREDLERTIEKLKGSPADQSAPGKAAELQAELAATDKEVLRLTVLMSELLPAAR